MSLKEFIFYFITVIILAVYLLLCLLKDIVFDGAEWAKTYFQNRNRK